MNHRYHLSRDLSPLLNPAAVLWVCLNPSTADDIDNDPTTTKIAGFSSRWGYGRFELVNLYPMRATKPRELLAAPEPQRIGDPVAEARAFARMHHPRIAEIVLAWGARASDSRIRHRVPQILGRVATAEKVRAKIAATVTNPEECALRVSCLGWTACGQPTHPLMLPYATPREAVDVQALIDRFGRSTTSSS